MKCPSHPDVELRRENYYSTGYCTKCALHYRMCTAVEFMNICDLPENHQGRHRDAAGREWNRK